MLKKLKKTKKGLNNTPKNQIQPKDPLPSTAEPLSEVPNGGIADVENSNFYGTKGSGQDLQFPYATLLTQLKTKIAKEGTWDSLISYDVGDVVTRRHNSYQSFTHLEEYICKQANSGEDPSTDDGTFWDTLVPTGSILPSSCLHSGLIRGNFGWHFIGTTTTGLANGFDKVKNPRLYAKLLTSNSNLIKDDGVSIPDFVELKTLNQFYLIGVNDPIEMGRFQSETLPNIEASTSNAADGGDSGLFRLLAAGGATGAFKKSERKSGDTPGSSFARFNWGNTDYDSGFDWEFDASLHNATYGATSTLTSGKVNPRHIGVGYYIRVS